jgi:(S)-ureidoglycine aminohydrolase
MKWPLLLLCLSTTSSLMAQTKDTLLSNAYHWNALKPVKKESSVTRQILEGKTFALNHFEVHATTLEPGKAPHPPHTHKDQDELVIVKEGQVTITINGISKTVGPGSIALIMPGDAHGIENAGNTQAAYYILKYGGKLPMDTARAKQAGGSLVLNFNDLKTSNTAKGYRRDYFNRATSQVPQFEMHTTALNVGEVSHAPHTHVQEEVILVLRGNVEMQIGETLRKGTTGDLYFVSSNVPHNLKNIGNEQCEYFAFQWRN